MIRIRSFNFAMWLRFALQIIGALALLALAKSARADQLSEDLSGLASSDASEVSAAIVKTANRGDARALPALHALDDGKLRFDTAKRLLIKSDSGAFTDALTGAATTAQGKVDEPASDNEVRRALSPALASLSLSAPSAAVRLKAAHELGRPSDEIVPILRKVLAKEANVDVKIALALALAPADMVSDKPADRIRALEAIRVAADATFKSDVEHLLSKSPDGKYVEPDANVRSAATAAIGSIETRQFLINSVGNTFYGLSLGSVLILCALGLAITFGLMGVINMAHGEMMMIGAYTSFVVQNFIANMPAHLDWYIAVAVPAAFVVSGAVGVLMERTVIRHLYGRPLETLLATWGISLLLIQTVRLIFGAQNVTVANPSWLSGGVEILPQVVLTYSRLAVIAFSVVVMLFVWVLMQKTRLGLEVRAVTQNRAMAAAMGISTRRVDMWTFGIGSGVAGLGGVALSQLGNVGPELGQGYIVDSFMVVVLGGVGKLAGTIAGGLGLGLVNKYLEPLAGAVLGKIFILGFIIVFIQRRPQGIFALKGRAAEVS